VEIKDEHDLANMEHGGVSIPDTLETEPLHVGVSFGPAIRQGSAIIGPFAPTRGWRHQAIDWDQTGICLAEVRAPSILGIASVAPQLMPRLLMRNRSRVEFMGVISILRIRRGSYCFSKLTTQFLLPPGEVLQTTGRQVNSPSLRDRFWG
jgi:hypothetical protein